MKDQILADDHYPLVPLRQLVPFPGSSISLDIGRALSKRAVEEARARADRRLLLLTQKDADEELPVLEGLYPVGVVATLDKVENNALIDGYKIKVSILGRVRLTALDVAPEVLHGRAEILEGRYTSAAAEEFMAQMNEQLTSALNKLNRVTKKLSASQLHGIYREPDAEKRVDMVANMMVPKMETRYEILSEPCIDKRLALLVVTLNQENEMIELEMDLNNRVKAAIDKSQKEYYLREKLKVIYQELGEGEDRAAEFDELAKKIEASLMPEAVKERARKELRRMRNSSPMSPEYGNTQNYLEFLVDLPWGKYKKNKNDLAYAQKILERDHYGLEKIKSRILEFLAVQFLKEDNVGSILCFVGPPGIGKTSLAQSIARALNRDFVRVALGGVQDVSEIRGHRRTYVGAIPGRLIQGLSDIGSANPVFLLDEIDKLTRDFKGDPSAALLEALDPEQNNTFSDHYLEVPFDLSKVFFITTANDIQGIPGPLRDRMEIIEMTSYTEYEKLQIAKKYLVSKAMDACGLEKGQLSFTDGALKDIISHYTREAGVRELERKIEAICRKHAKAEFLGEKHEGKRVTKTDVKAFLGNPLVDHLETGKKDEIGVAVGLAWTPVGGEILQIESLSMPGSGKLYLTGRLGDVMRESAQISLSYLRSVSDDMGIPEKFTDTHDIHIHVPSGAVPKEGPSAGVTLTTSLLSMMIQKPLRQDVAMTGEITLRGKVLAVGGIREKVTAAHRAGSKVVVIPKDCEKDLEDIPREVRDALEIHTASRIEEVWRIAFRDEVVK
ncbi:MAG: endopeptidase La [Peptococcaceae bacterium]|nr:endopeptidase La [Peptococcaceae bacterium]